MITVGIGSKWSRIIWGMFFIACGTLLVLHFADILNAPEGITTWTIILSILFVPCLIEGLAKLNWFEIFFSAAFLVLVWQRPIYDAVGVRPGFWILMLTALLLSIGFTTLFGGLGSSNTVVIDGKRRKMKSKKGSSSKESYSGKDLYFKQKLAASEKYVRSENLSRVRIKNTLGSLELYFDSTTVSPEGLVIEVDNNLANLELYVPRDWKIIDQMENSLASFSTVGWDDGAFTTVTLRGKNSLANLEVNYR